MALLIDRPISTNRIKTVLDHIDNAIRQLGLELLGFRQGERLRDPCPVLEAKFELQFIVQSLYLMSHKENLVESFLIG